MTSIFGSWPWPRVKVRLCSNLENGMLKGCYRKKCCFLSQSIDFPMFHSISKNQLRRSIKREAGIWNVDSVKAIDVYYKGFDFSDHCTPFTVPTYAFLEKFFFCFDIVPYITHHQIEPGSWNLVCRFSIGSRCVFLGFWFFSFIASPYSLKDVAFWLIFLIFWVYSSHNT